MLLIFSPHLFPTRTPFGDWWLLVPALCVGFLGGGVYVGAFSLIAQDSDQLTNPDREFHIGERLALREWGHPKMTEPFGFWGI